jgi:hypothetical protein
MNEIEAVDEPDELCGEEEFAELVTKMVHDEAPRLFAVVQELGKREDGRVAAWGLAFENRAQLVHSDGRSLLSARSPERACWLLSRNPDVTARLVWVDPTSG